MTSSRKWRCHKKNLTLEDTFSLRTTVCILVRNTIIQAWSHFPRDFTEIPCAVPWQWTAYQRKLHAKPKTSVLIKCVNGTCVNDVIVGACLWHYLYINAGIILGMGSTNEKRRYMATPPLIVRLPPPRKKKKKKKKKKNPIITLCSNSGTHSVDHGRAHGQQAPYS